MNFETLTPIARMEGEDAEESAQLRVMYERARGYLATRSWHPVIGDAYFGFGIGGVVAVFLLHVKATAMAVDEWMWVVEGDFPSAYLVTDRAVTPAAALGVYCELMQDWIEAVRSGTSLEDVFPVDAPPDEEHADMLSERISSLKTDIIPAASCEA